MNQRVAHIAIGPIEHHKSGWALMGLSPRCAHWWVAHSEKHYADQAWLAIAKKRHPDLEPIRIYESACGLDEVTTAAVPAIVPGNYPHCKRCQRALVKQANENPGFPS